QCLISSYFLCLVVWIEARWIKNLGVSSIVLGGSAFFFLLIDIISQTLVGVRKEWRTGTLRERSTTKSCMLHSGRMNGSPEGIY
ncbi:hypothetical protein PHJA_000489100, partial [Phtheirospermum japonicum]